MCKRFIVLLAVFGLLAWSSSASFAQDDCASAAAIDGNGSASGTTTGSSAGGAPVLFPDAPAHWYSVVGNGALTIANTCAEGSNYDTAMTVLTGDCDNLTVVSSNDDDNCGLGGWTGRSSVAWDSEDGVTYYIVVHGWNTENGNYELTTTQGEALSLIHI